VYKCYQANAEDITYKRMVLAPWFSFFGKTTDCYARHFF